MCRDNIKIIEIVNVLIYHTTILIYQFTDISYNNIEMNNDARLEFVGNKRDNLNNGYGYFYNDKLKLQILQYWNDGVLIGTQSIMTDIIYEIKDFDDIKITNENELTSDELEKLVCPIGVQRIIPVTTSCNHKFCRTKIEKYNIMENKMTCPLCRSQIEYLMDDIDATNILKKCEFTVNNKQIGYDMLVKYYEFLNNPLHRNKRDEKEEKKRLELEEMNRLRAEHGDTENALEQRPILWVRRTRVSSNFANQPIHRLHRRLININTASLDELMKLRGIGRNLASNIISHRETFGLFVRKEDITRVNRLGDITYSYIQNSICC